MMGRSHLATGLLASVSTVVVVHPAPLAAGVLVAVGTGAALLPDLDHHSGTLARTYGPITGWTARLVAWLSGGHRHGTHSLIGIAVFSLPCAVLAGPLRHTAWSIPAALVVLLSLGGLVRLLAIPGWLDDLAPVPLVIGLVWFTTVDLSMVPVAVAVGCAAHIAGDMLTPQGCPLLWPVSKARSGLPIMTTNGTFERYAVIPVCAVAVAVEVYITVRGTA